MKEAKHLTIYPKHNHVRFKATTVALLETHGWRDCCTTPSCCLQLFCLVVARRKPVKLLGKRFPPSWTIGGEGGVRKVWFSTYKKVANHFLKERNSARCVHPSIKTEPLFQTSQQYSSLWLYLDGSFLWNLLYTSSLQTCNRRTSRPVRGEIMCYDSNVILSSDKTCCIVSLTTVIRKRKK